MSRELKYWEHTGLALGTERYQRYLDLFGLREDSLAGRTVCDYGCGPFGGVLSVLRGVWRAYPVDILAADYNAWGRCPTPILGVSAGRCPSIPDRSCDAVFCLNVFDHIRNRRRGVQELARITKPRGRLYLFVHLRPETKGHYRVPSREMAKRFARTDGRFFWNPWAPQWTRIAWDTGADVPNQEPHLNALWCVMEPR